MYRSVLVILLVGFLMAPPIGAQHTETQQAALVHQRDAIVFALQRENAELKAHVADLEAKLASVLLTQRAAELQKSRQDLETVMCAEAHTSDQETCTVDWTQTPPIAVRKPKDARQ